MSDSGDSWEKSHYLSLTLWDIDLQFQKAKEAYEEWQTAKKRRSRARWGCFGSKREDDELAKALRLGRRVQELMEKGTEVFGHRFDRGDSICNSILSAQLLRVQHEIHVPLLDCAQHRPVMPIPFDDLLTAAKAVRRTCLHALRDQYARLQSPTSTPFLPPPRFSVRFCPLALRLQKDKSATFQTKKVRPHDRHDEREICSCCAIDIPVSQHSGLPQSRRLLFESHLASPENNPAANAKFACTSCYKTFDDSYGFLDHVFQKEIGSEHSCLRRWSLQVTFQQVFMESDPVLVEKSLKKSLKREVTRVRVRNKSRELENYAPRPLRVVNPG
ncbi:hypothetical protein B0J11DRAFT_108419 [Dendryphion nanum]|uniref:C2H2-type domain-containing protein n=1 Tax=Dendryphion nanum TaxID=256645 RepID=A0A9P9IF36_9PLEO|nr:hypothetical protein B0J11DRAFT_108419 [Dendryphion nanum]